jgi:hypothetical protein
LFLQASQAGPSVYEAHTQPSRPGNHGERVIDGKRMVQTATDFFVGWGSLHGKDHYIRQFRGMKIIPATELIASPARRVRYRLRRDTRPYRRPGGHQRLHREGPQVQRRDQPVRPPVRRPRTNKTTPSSSAPSPPTPSRACQPDISHIPHWPCRAGVSYRLCK